MSGKCNELAHVHLCAEGVVEGALTRFLHWMGGFRPFPGFHLPYYVVSILRIFLYMYIYIFFIQVHSFKDIKILQGIKERGKGSQGLYSPRTSRAVDRAVPAISAVLYHTCPHRLHWDPKKGAGTKGAQT